MPTTPYMCLMPSLARACATMLKPLLCTADSVTALLLLLLLPPSTARKTGFFQVAVCCCTAHSCGLLNTQEQHAVHTTCLQHSFKHMIACKILTNIVMGFDSQDSKCSSCLQTVTPTRSSITVADTTPIVNGSSLQFFEQIQLWQLQNRKMLSTKCCLTIPCNCSVQGLRS